ncbi:QueT transporter family protein [Pseudobutyrivibrio xylanivorans]|uniref:Uncharacterized membrane protein n=1 Tax=Pseudobutyrivibrio xylanivorans TaxID=185007 RepID=A0A1G5RXU8_PSEXY|nr:QueT transporter family protein [Pseudobutyrivibrio xylanivorans]SCZ78836.1 Uncharacterized membrane protein [Pseudobutyrivibrio xylanivorans]
MSNNENKNRNKILLITQGAMIAALYVVLTWVANVLGLANGAIQVRFSEALCILPIFTPAAIPGLFVGCLISNIINGCVIWDIIFGSLATLIGAFGTYFLRKTKFIFTLPPVIANMAIVPFVLRYAYMVEDAYWFLVVTVGIGEVISVCILGFILKIALDKNKRAIFGQDN